MISERDIAGRFTAIWRQYLPLLTPNFMRVFNETQIANINTSAVSVNGDVRYDLISEVAFNLATVVISNHISTDDYLSVESQVTKLLAYTAKDRWADERIFRENLSTDELNTIKAVSNNIVEFVQVLKKETAEFKPQLRGYSFIPDLVADLSIDDTLFEIKTVNRNFTSADLKQLFLYLALQQVSGHTRWKYGGLYNPRRGTFCKFSVKSLIYHLTGGKSPNETFESLLNSLVRDIEIDSKF